MRRKHRIHPRLAAAQRQGLAARSREGDTHPFEQRGSVRLEAGLSQRRFTQIEDHVGSLRLDEAQDLRGVSTDTGDDGVFEHGGDVFRRIVQCELLGPAVAPTLRRRQRMQNEDLQKVDTSWQPGS